MSITLISHEQKSHAIDWLKASLTLFIMPYTTATMRSKIHSHVAHLDTHPGAYDVTCRIETGNDGTIQITTAIKPIGAMDKSNGR